MNEKNVLQKHGKEEKTLEEILEETAHTRIDLPSNGVIYPKNNVLSKGVLHMRYLKGKDEEVLLSPSKIQESTFADVLLNQVILEPDFNVKDLSIGDKTYLVLASRISSLGDDYAVKEIKCQNQYCDHVEKNYEIKLSESIGDAPKIHDPVESNKNLFKTTLPTSGDEVSMRTITGHDLDEITKMENNLQRTGQELTMLHTLSILIESVSTLGEDPSQRKIIEYLEEASFPDMGHLRKFLKEIRRTPENTISYKCPSCGTDQKIAISLGIDFFFPEY